MSNEDNFIKLSKENESLNMKDQYNISFLGDLNKNFEFFDKFLNFIIDNFPKESKINNKDNIYFNFFVKHNDVLYQKIFSILEKFNNNLKIPLVNICNNIFGKKNEIINGEVDNNNFNIFKLDDFEKFEKFINIYCQYLKEIGNILLDYSNNIIIDINIYKEEIKKINTQDNIISDKKIEVNEENKIDNEINENVQIFENNVNIEENDYKKLEEEKNNENESHPNINIYKREDNEITKINEEEMKNCIENNKEYLENKDTNIILKNEINNENKINANSDKNEGKEINNDENDKNIHSIINDAKEPKEEYLIIDTTVKINKDDENKEKEKEQIIKRNENEGNNGKENDFNSDNNKTNNEDKKEEEIRDKLKDRKNTTENYYKDEKKNEDKNKIFENENQIIEKEEIQEKKNQSKMEIEAKENKEKNEPISEINITKDKTEDILKSKIESELDNKSKEIIKKNNNNDGEFKNGEVENKNKEYDGAINENNNLLIKDNIEHIENNDIIVNENINKKEPDKRLLPKDLEIIVEEIINSIINELISEKEQLKNKNDIINGEKDEKEEKNFDIKAKEEKYENKINDNLKDETFGKNKEKQQENTSIDEEDEIEEEENIIVLNKLNKISDELESNKQSKIEENKYKNNQIKEKENKLINEEINNRNDIENENNESDISIENNEKNIDTLLDNISCEEENININKEIDEKNDNNEIELDNKLEVEESLKKNDELLNKKEENNDTKENIGISNNDDKEKDIEKNEKINEIKQENKINNENIDEEFKSSNEKIIENEHENNNSEKERQKKIIEENNIIDNSKGEDSNEKELKNNENNKDQEYDFDLDEEDDIDIIIKNKKNTNNSEINSNLNKNKDNNEEKLEIPNEIKENENISLKNKIKDNQKFNNLNSNNNNEIKAIQENKNKKIENQKIEEKKNIINKNESKLTLPLFPSVKQKEIYIESAIKKILSPSSLLDDEFNKLIDILFKNDEENIKHFFSIFLNILKKRINKKIRIVQNFDNFKKLLNIIENICIKEKRAYMFDLIIETSQYLKYDNIYLYQYLGRKIPHFKRNDFWKILIENLLINSLNERVKYIINRESRKNENSSMTERGQKKISWKNIFSNIFNDESSSNDEDEEIKLKKEEKNEANIIEIMGYSKYIIDFKKLNNKLKKELDVYANKTLEEILSKNIVNMSKLGFNFDNMKILILNFCAQFGFSNELKEYYINLIDCYQYKNHIHIKQNLILKNNNNNFSFNDSALACIISNAFLFMPIKERYKLIKLNKKIYISNNIKHEIFKKILRKKNLDLDKRLLIWEDILEIKKLEKKYNYEEIKKDTFKKIENGELIKGTRIFNNNETIDKDVNRTIFLENKIENQKKLSDILKSLNIFIPSLGYYQGISYIAAFLLQILNFNEEKTFFYMLSLETKTEYKELFKDNLKMMNENFRIFEKILEIGAPDVHLHLKKFGIMADYYTPSWFLTIFSCVSPIFDVKNLSKFCILVFEKFIFDGWDAVFNAGFTCLKHYSKEILKTREENILNYLTTEFINKDIFKNIDYDNAEKNYINNSGFINSDLISMINKICKYEQKNYEEEI